MWDNAAPFLTPEHKYITECGATLRSRGLFNGLMVPHIVLAPENAQLPISSPRASPVASVDRSVATLTVIYGHKKEADTVRSIQKVQLRHFHDLR
jgi:hypothetical protein